MPSPSIGAKAPEFKLPDQDGKVHSLAGYRGKYVALYWYPKDATPGCTKEACGFRDTNAEFARLGAVVLGASILDSASKARFAARQNLNFPLLADEDHKTAEAYGVWKKKSMAGKTYFGISRETFLIGPGGAILKHWPEAKGNESHSEEVLNALKEIAAAQ